MDFAWDDRKNARLRAERGFAFEDVVPIFAGHTVEAIDARRDYGEERVIAIGADAGIIYTVVYTDRGWTRRLISARLANRRERQRWLASRSKTR